jgi:UDPglucose 6-dehydrogenase
MKNILCIGAGYAGGPTMAVIASHCLNDRVVVVDINQEIISAWQSDQLPIYESGVNEMVHHARGRNLFFSSDKNQHIAVADIIFVSVNTPTKNFGQEIRKASDLQYWESQILENSTTSKIVVEKRTLPVRTAEALEVILNSIAKDLHFDIVSNPEFLAEGTILYLRPLWRSRAFETGRGRLSDGCLAIPPRTPVLKGWGVSPDDFQFIPSNIFISCHQR